MMKQTLEKMFLTVYDTHADAIFRHCYFRVYDRERARELMQEAFTKTWEYLANGKKIKNIRAFVYKTANNLIIDQSRKKKEASVEALDDAGQLPTAPTIIPNVVDTALLLAKLEKVDASYRHAVYMRYVDGLSPKEIAEISGESVNVISVRIHRGVKKLKELYSES